MWPNDCEVVLKQSRSPKELCCNMAANFVLMRLQGPEKLSAPEVCLLPFSA